MTNDLERLRAEAAEHGAQLAAAGWPGVPELAAKWGVSRPSVRKIPREHLPYLEFGDTKMRRYDPADVARYEQTAKHGHAA